MMRERDDKPREGDYRPAAPVRTRLYMLVVVFTMVAGLSVWLGWRAYSGPTATPGTGAVLLGVAFAAAVFCVTIAYRMLRWLEMAYLRLSAEGITYAEPSGTLHTPWENVERIERRRIAFTFVGGLRLRAPARASRSDRWRLLAWLQPLFLPGIAVLGDRFIPLTTLGVDLRTEAPIARQLRRLAPWLFTEEGQPK